MLQFFGVLSGTSSVIAVIPYSRDIFRGKTKPHRGSFFIWSVLGGIAFFAQLAKGATWSLFLPGTDMLATFSIFILAIWHGVGGLNRRDVSGLLLALLGLLLWYLSKQPLLALCIAIGVDGIGTVLTLIKTWEEPNSETFSSWFLAALSGLFAILAVGGLSFVLLIYPVYILLANGSIGAVILIRQGRVGSQ